jgi:hypothetical protein
MRRHRRPSRRVLAVRRWSAGWRPSMLEPVSHHRPLEPKTPCIADPASPPRSSWS